jgi:hypothetical protein
MVVCINPPIGISGRPIGSACEATFNKLFWVTADDVAFAEALNCTPINRPERQKLRHLAGRSGLKAAPFS